MLRPSWFDPLLDRRTDERAARATCERERVSRERVSQAHGLSLRRPLGHALIELGRLVAAERPPRHRPQRRRAY